MENRNSLSLQRDCLSVEVTTHCNSLCRHCFVRARGANKSSLDRDLVRVLVQEGYETGFRHLHITGGEPLLWDGLSSIFDYAFGLGYHTAFLNTNGTLLTDQVCRELAVYGSLAISVTLQGPRQFHDSMRGAGSYDRAARGIANALSAGLPVFVFAPVGRSLVPELPHFAEGLFKALPDIRELTAIQLIRVPSDTFDLSDEVLRPEDFLRLVCTLSFLSVYGMRVNILNNPLAVVASKILNAPPLPPSPPLCQLGDIMITAEKRVTFAHSTTDNLGTFRPGILHEIVRSDDYLRVVSRSPPVCLGCVHSDLCRQEGMLRPSEWYQDMFSQIPYCQRVLAEASSQRRTAGLARSSV